MKGEVDTYKKRLVEKVEEAKQLAQEEVPEHPEVFLRKTSQVRRVLESRVNSFSECQMRYQGMAETDKTSETDKLFQQDAEANRALIEEARELMGELGELLEGVRENEKKALEKEVKEAQQTRVNEQAASTKRIEDEKLKLQREQLEFTQKMEHDKATLSKELELKRFELEKESQAFLRKTEEEKRKQEVDFANRQQQLEGELKAKAAEYSQNLEQVRLQLEKAAITPACHSSALSFAPHEASVKLPKLEFPKFYGDITKWRDFCDSFQSAVHNNAKLADINKLNYLRAQLGGEALGVISGLQLTGENYQVAIALLRERYGDQSRIRQAH